MTTCALVGATYFNEQDFLNRYHSGRFDCVVAVDGGFAALEKAGIKPDMAVGDFDSLGYVPRAKRVSRYPEHKDMSDMEIGFTKAFNFKHDTVYMYGGIGGRLDHTLANLQLIASYSERGLYVTAIADTFAIRAVTGPDAFTLPCDLDLGTVSVFAANDRCEGVIERGLEYSLDDEPLTNRTSLGLSNELCGNEATIAVESGTLYVFYPLSNSASPSTDV